LSQSYWKKQAELPPQSDVIIVGGGFIGLSVAYWLMKTKPLLKITILDSQALGEGASGRNAGFLTKGSLSFYEHLSLSWGKSAAEDIYDFAQESINLVLSELKFEDFLSTSSFTLYPSIKEFNFKGFSRVRAILPQIKDCFEVRGEVSINPMRLLKELEARVREKGVAIFRGVECFQLIGKTVHTNFGNISGEQIVLALNGHINTLVPGLVAPQRAQMLCVELERDVLLPGLMYAPDDRVYFKSIGERKLVIGGKRLVEPIAENTAILGINLNIQTALENYVISNIGSIKTVHARWSGIMGFSSDELPIIEKKENYYLIAGFSGHGMGFGFNASRNLSDMMIEGKSSFFQSIRNNSLQSE